MSFTDFHFIRPYWLLAFIPYLLILALMLRNKLARGNWSAVCDAALLPYLLKDKAVKQSRWPTAFGAVAALLAILGMAGPAWKKLPSPVFRNDSALVIALDLSRSMDAEDIKPSRLIRARYKIADMLRQRKDGQTALLVYAGDAFTVTPLTNDNETIASQLEALATDIMPVPGKNTVAVLNKAVELFKQAGQRKGQIVLMTDGVDLDKTLEAVRALDNYSLSILGVGTPEGAPIALPAGGFLKDGQGTIVIPKLNDGDLTRLASAGSGIYRSLTADDADVRAVLAHMGGAEPSKQGNGDNQLVLDLWEDQGPYLLLLVLPLAALSFRKGLLGVALLLILPFPEPSYALAWNDLWLTRDQQAAKAYGQGQYDQAARLFENLDWKLAAQYKANQPAFEKMPTPESATGFYNQGNVLAKSGRLEEAVAAYKKSLEIDPANEDARFNKDLVEKELEKRKKQQEQNQDQQQQQDNQQQAKDKDPSEQKQGGEPERNKEGNKEEENASDQSDSNSEQPDENQEASKEQQQNRPEEKPSAENNPQAEQNPEGKNEPEEGRSQQSINGAQPTDEQQQANEQWLNRIPDDPAGLLKRKFKYQYGQRQRQ
ncbi:MAG: VWA domain-containing protein [Methylosarcina sp.]